MRDGSAECKEGRSPDRRRREVESENTVRERHRQCIEKEEMKGMRWAKELTRALLLLYSW